MPPQPRGGRWCGRCPLPLPMLLAMLTIMALVVPLGYIATSHPRSPSSTSTSSTASTSSTVASPVHLDKVTVSPIDPAMRSPGAAAPNRQQALSTLRPLPETLAPQTQTASSAQEHPVTASTTWPSPQPRPARLPPTTPTTPSNPTSPPSKANAPDQDSLRLRPISPQTLLQLQSRNRSSSSSSSGPSPSSHMELVSLVFGKCIDSGNPPWPGEALRMWACHHGVGGPYQHFEMDARGRLLQQVPNQPPRCIAVIAVASTAQPRPQLLPCAAVSANATAWIPLRPTSTHSVVMASLVLLQHPGTGLCLTLPRNDQADLRMEPCSRSCRQLWNIPALLGALDRLPADRPTPAPRRRSAHPRILCWVLTTPAEFAGRARVVQHTWGSRCDTLLFVAAEDDPNLPILQVDLQARESRDLLWRKSQLAWNLVADRHLGDADWFIKTDDDTYVVMDNLRAFLREQNPDDPVHFGRPLTSPRDPTHFSSAYYSGGAGIVMSRETLSRWQMAQRWANRTRIFGESDNTQPEDLMTSVALHQLGVRTTTDTLDAEGRNRFFTLGIDTERSIRRRDSPTMWYWTRTYAPREGPDCCSPRWISTHYISALAMVGIDLVEQGVCRSAVDEWPYLEVEVSL